MGAAVEPSASQADHQQQQQQKKQQEAEEGKEAGKDKDKHASGSKGTAKGSGGGGVLDGVRAVLKQGVSAHELSLCVAIGVVGGLWPVPLTSWIGCVLLQSVAGVRPVLATVIQAVNFAMTPVELATFAYFISAGEEVRDMVSGSSAGSAARFDASSLVSDLQSDLLGGLQSASGALLIGLGSLHSV